MQPLPKPHPHGFKTTREVRAVLNKVREWMKADFDDEVDDIDLLSPDDLEQLVARFMERHP